MIAKVNGIELGYEVFGEGEPLVLLHGGFGSLEMFGPNIELLAAGRRVVGVDLQSHGRSPAADRPLRFESMADDIAALVGELGLERAAVMGFSLGGGVALRTALQHPQVVERLVLVSTVFKRRGWHPEMTAGMDAMGPGTADQMMATPLYDAYKRVAPRVEDWPVLVGQLTEAIKLDYDWAAALPRGRVLQPARRRPARRRLGRLRCDPAPPGRPARRDPLRHQRRPRARRRRHPLPRRRFGRSLSTSSAPPNSPTFLKKCVRC
jgi:pimeloyl-ACP methyl ester carboxylesterase